MSERATPETDAAWLAFEADLTCDEGDPWGLASKLERQRDEAREIARELRDALAGMEEYYRQHVMRGSLFLQVHAALTKAEEVLG